MDKVKVTATIRRSEYYEVELVVPDYYSYEDIESEVREKFYDLCVENGISPYDEEEEIWNIDEETINE